MNEAAKKDVLRRFTYGLYALTTRSPDGLGHAMLVNWITQISFEPPMLAVSVENDSLSLQLILQTHVFTVNVLPSGSRELAGRLGKRSARVPDKLAGMEHWPGRNGCPLLAEALGYVECEVVGSLPAGDSTVFVASIVQAGALSEGTPLTMAEAGFRHAG